MWVVLAFGCKSSDKEYDREIVDPKIVMSYKENDSLVLKKMPAGLQKWLTSYQGLDSSFQLHHFKASGVKLHLSHLEDAVSNSDEKAFSSFFVYSPDSSRYLDLVSYDHLLENGKLVDGEADQQVVLGDTKNKNRKQLMFNGPAQTAEFADWTGPDSFILGIVSSDDVSGALQAELLFFHLKDSSYTNFTLDHRIAVDSLMLLPKNFLDHFLTNPAVQ